MPMELYSSEAFVRDLVNAISKSEGKPMNIGGARHHGIDRPYAFQLITEAKRAVEGNFAPVGAASPAKAPASRSDAIKKLMTKLDKQDAAARKPRTRAAAKALPAA
ncbi:MAG: hypothetical protein EON55_09170 [Alphaproteobacteria bacterium]|nr:MAG: hypothetical protein EON55_09170 [Alphaproteobacteria bacterium]